MRFGVFLLFEQGNGIKLITISNAVTCFVIYTINISESSFRNKLVICLFILGKRGKSDVGRARFDLLFNYLGSRSKTVGFSIISVIIIIVVFGFGANGLGEEFILNVVGFGKVVPCYDKGYYGSIF